MKRAYLRTIGMSLVIAGLLAAGCGRGKSPEAKSTGKPAQTKQPATPAPELVSNVGPVDGDLLDPAVAAGTSIEKKPSANPPVTASYGEAETAYFAGRYGEAATLFESYAGAHPDNFTGQYMLGLSLWKSGKPKEAETAFHRALELKPTHVKSLTNLSRVLLDEGRAEEALPMIAKAVDIDPTNGDALRVRGRAFHNLGQTEQAIESYKQAIALNDKDAWALNNLGLLLIESGRCEEAIPPLARATRLSSGVACFHNNLGIALEQTGRYRAAAGAYAGALEADSSYSKASTNLARVQVVKEDPTIPEIDLATLGDSFRVESQVEPNRVEQMTVGGTVGSAEQ
jgi:Flp pilus assembly protein TadD